MFRLHISLEREIKDENSRISTFLSLLGMQWTLVKLAAGLTFPAKAKMAAVARKHHDVIYNGHSFSEFFLPACRPNTEKHAIHYQIVLLRS